MKFAPIIVQDLFYNIILKQKTEKNIEVKVTLYQVNVTESNQKYILN